MEIAKIVDGVKKHGGRVLLGAALAASAVTLVRPAEVNADSGPVCRTNLFLENNPKIEGGKYLVNGGKAEFRVETKIIGFGGNAPKDSLWAPEIATLSTDRVTEKMNPNDIDPEAIEMEKVGTLDNGVVVFRGKVSPEGAVNLTKSNVILTDGNTCTAENQSSAELAWRSNLKKVIAHDLSALSYTIVLTK